MNQKALYNLWRRFSSWKEAVYAPATAEVKALTEEERLQFLEYAFDPERDFAIASKNGWLGRVLGLGTPSYTWKRLVRILPDSPKDFRYIAIYLELLNMAWGSPGRLDALSLHFCTLLSHIDTENVSSISRATRDRMFRQLDRAYQDTYITRAILEVVPLFCAEGVLYQLEALSRKDKDTLDKQSLSATEMQLVSAAAKIALKRLQEHIEEKLESDALLRPALAPDEANSLLRPAHDPIETKQEELLRPAEKQKRNE
ncbi:hypothetical protein LBMAG21_07870 [Armatimonadota bacterium]|nr:hypothetical protein LBMAG21_07870 [Armatimonadota bacterium]